MSRLSRAILVLPLRDAAGLSRLLAAQQDPASPDFRRWLTPEEFGDRFGASEADVAALRAHLEANGLEVEDVPGGRMALVFSGRAADVERAFSTELHEVFVDGAVRVANVLPARLPLGLARRTAGLLSLNSFPRRRPLARRAPAYTDGSGHSLAPADFATIYGIDALAAAGINGAGRQDRRHRADERRPRGHALFPAVLRPRGERPAGRPERRRPRNQRRRDRGGPRHPVGRRRRAGRAGAARRLEGRTCRPTAWT